MLIIIAISFAAFGAHKFLDENETYKNILEYLPEWLRKPLGKCLYCFAFWVISVPTLLLLTYLTVYPYIIFVFIPPFLASLLSSILEYISKKKELLNQKIYTETLIQQGTHINNQIIKNKLNG